MAKTVKYVVKKDGHTWQTHDTYNTAMRVFSKILTYGYRVEIWEVTTEPDGETCVAQFTRKNPYLLEEKEEMANETDKVKISIFRDEDDELNWSVWYDGKLTLTERYTGYYETTEELTVARMFKVITKLAMEISHGGEFALEQSVTRSSWFWSIQIHPGNYYYSPKFATRQMAMSNLGDSLDASKLVMTKILNALHDEKI